MGINCSPSFPVCSDPTENRLLGVVFILMLKVPDISPDKLKVKLKRREWLICEVFLPHDCAARDRKAREAEPAQPREPINNSRA